MFGSRNIISERLEIIIPIHTDSSITIGTILRCPNAINSSQLKVNKLFHSIFIFNIFLTDV